MKPQMKAFHALQVDEAKAWAMAGGIALHLHRIIVDRAKAPACFVRAVDAGEFIAHLFDQDELRLYLTARRLGVKIVVIEHAGTPRMHVDLCGGPLKKAMAEATPPDDPSQRIDSPKIGSAPPTNDPEYVW